MGALADDVRVFAGRQVEALDGPELLEDLERPEDRRSPDPEPLSLRFRQELPGREVGIASSDQRGQPPARLRQPVSGAVKDRYDRRGVHGRSVPQLRLCLNTSASDPAWSTDGR
jgi:hypothetical protein